MSKHTSAPWYYTEDAPEAVGSDCLGCVIVAELDGVRVYSKTATRTHATADAKLLAAAPDLLEALCCVVRWHREHDSGAGELFGRDYVTTSIFAIAKAEGHVL